MRLLGTITALLIPLCAAATGAFPYPVTVMQPDGTTISIVMHGDEFSRWSTDMHGNLMVKEQDGFWHRRGAVDYDRMKQVRSVNLQKYRDDLSAESPATKACLTVTDELVLVIPVQFNDVKFSRVGYREYLHTKLNQPLYSEDGATGSAKDYFEANFTGRTFTFDVTEVVTLADNEADYGHNDESVPSVIQYDSDMSRMVREACSAVNSEINFGKYDQDGDGKVDHLILVYAGYNEAEGGGDDTIWSHEWDVTNHRFIFDGVQIGLYACASELRGATGSIDAGIGTFCHELSHTFGLKDLYDVDYGKNGTCSTLWRSLSLMDYGNFNNDGHTPPYYSAVDRMQAGVAEFCDLIPGTVELKPVYEGGSIYRLETGVDGEFFLFECRMEKNWDSFIGGHGMLVYHIDMSPRMVSGIKASVRWTENIINTVSEHECADLIEAMDGASAVSQVFFPGQGMVEEFGPMTIPALESWESEGLGIRLSDIREDGDVICFTVCEDYSERMLHVLNPIVQSYQKDAVVSWSSEKGGAAWGVRWKKSASDDYSEIIVGDMEARMTELEPGTDYRCEIFYKGKRENGDTVAVSFTTGSYTSIYPYMSSLRKSYDRYDRLLLKVQNVQEDVKSIKWLYDGRIVLGDILELTEAGSHILEVVLIYAGDGSSETITKTINVNETSGGL